MIYIVKARTLAGILVVGMLGFFIDLLFGGLEPGDGGRWFGAALASLVIVIGILLDTNTIKDRT